MGSPVEPAAGADVCARDRLIQAATEVFLEKGYLDTRISDISKRSHYTSGAIYMHFASRSDLLNQAILSAGDRYIEEIVNRVAALQPGLKGYSQMLSEIATTDPSPFDALIMMALALETREHDRGRSWIHSLERLDDALATVIHDRVEAGLIDPAIDIDALRTLLSSWLLGTFVYRAVQLPLAGPERSKELHDRFYEAIALHGHPED